MIEFWGLHRVSEDVRRVASGTTKTKIDMKCNGDLSYRIQVTGFTSEVANLLDRMTVLLGRYRRFPRQNSHLVFTGCHSKDSVFMSMVLRSDHQR